MLGSNTAGILPVMNVDGNRDGGWGMDGGIWAWFILAIFFGWGGNGFGWGGNGNNANSQFTDAALQRGFDQQNVVGKLDRLGDGICSLGYDQLAQMNGINTNIMQSAFGLQSAIDNCCCTTNRNIDQVRYDMATNTCAITTAMNQGFAQLDRTINDQFCDLKMEQKDAQIAAMQNQLNMAALAASQEAQTRELTNTLRPCPIPAYATCNPWASNGTAFTSCNGFGYNSGCGCAA